jgi:hypothetical protein
MGSTFGLALLISHFLFFLLTFVQAPATSKGHISDEELLLVPSRIFHFLMRHYISPLGRFYIPDGHMTQFPALCDYIDQGRAQ